MKILSFLAFQSLKGFILLTKKEVSSVNNFVQFFCATVIKKAFTF